MLKDWIKISKGYFDKAEGYGIDKWANKKDKNKIVYIEKSTEDRRTYYYAGCKFDYEYISLCKLKEKAFKTKSEALKYVKAYMRKN